MNLYELVNPTDRITFRTDVPQVAALLTLLIGRGMFAADPINEDGTSREGFGVPILINDIEKWWDQNFDEPLEGAGDRRLPELRDGFRSVCVGPVALRPGFDTSMALLTDDKEARDAFVLSWENQYGTSMARIMSRSQAAADRIDEQLAEGGAA
jgi:hypothetical protein